MPPHRILPMGLSCRNPGAKRWRAVTPVVAVTMVATATAFSPGVAAMSPFPFFQRVEHVGLLCSVDADPERVAVVEEAALCGFAVAELRDLVGAGGPPVTAFGRNDERIADPATLLVLLHATVRSSTPAEEGGATNAVAGTGTVLALSAGLHRARTDVGAPPFFATAPQAVVTPAGAPNAEPLRAALRRLLAGVARPLLANR